MSLVLPSISYFYSQKVFTKELYKKSKNFFLEKIKFYKNNKTTKRNFCGIELYLISTSIVLILKNDISSIMLFSI